MVHDNNCISVQDKDQASREVQGAGKCSDDWPCVNNMGLNKRKSNNVDSDQKVNLLWFMKLWWLGDKHLESFPIFLKPTIKAGGVI